MCLLIFNVSFKRSLISSYNVIWTLLEKLTMILLCFSYVLINRPTSPINLSTTLCTKTRSRTCTTSFITTACCRPRTGPKVKSSPLLLANGFHSSYRNLTFFSIIWKNTVHIAYFTYSSVKVVIYVWGGINISDRISLKPDKIPL